MRRDLDALARRFDLLVIGAGIHGACIARLAALNGLSVALIDKGDFGAATSRNSAKLLHGGLRYMQHLDITRIRESMVAQRAWFRFAPHLVRPLRFVIPTYGYGTRGPVALGGAMALFHLIAADRNSGIRSGIRMHRSSLMSRRRLLADFPMLDRPGVTGGACWHDGQMLDATRITLECVWDAKGAGAVVANHVECLALLHGAAGVQGCVARDRLDGREFEIRASLTVNATGPWIDRLLETGPTALRGSRTTVWTRNINLVTRSLYEGNVALGVASRRVSDAAIGQSKRLFFASPWHGCTVIGTAHGHSAEHPDEIVASGDIVKEFMDEINEALPEIRLTASDVHSVHVGLTPAEEGESERAKRSLLIDHAVRQGVPGLISVAGIKYTTAPVVAARTVTLACRHLRHAAPVRPFEQASAGTPVELSTLSRDSGDERAWATRIYGQRAAECLGGTDPAAEDMSDRVFRSRVRYGIEQEMVLRLSDALLRATDWAERGQLTAAQLDWSAQALAAAHGWAPDRLNREKAHTQAAFDRLMIRCRRV